MWVRTQMYRCMSPKKWSQSGALHGHNSVAARDATSERGALWHACMPAGPAGHNSALMLVPLAFVRIHARLACVPRVACWCGAYVRCPCPSPLEPSRPALQQVRQRCQEGVARVAPHATSWECQPLQRPRTRPRERSWLRVVRQAKANPSQCSTSEPCMGTTNCTVRSIGATQGAAHFLLT
jgi:hypothetical protein